MLQWCFRRFGVIAALFVACWLLSVCAPNGELRTFKLNALKAFEDSISDMARPENLPGIERETRNATIPTWHGTKAAPLPKPKINAGKRTRISLFVSKKVAAKQQFKCAICGEILDETWEIDHIVPLHLAGSDDLDNLQAVHKRCHMYKNSLEQRTPRQ